MARLSLTLHQPKNIVYMKNQSRMMQGGMYALLLAMLAVLGGCGSRGTKPLAADQPSAGGAGDTLVIDLRTPHGENWLEGEEIPIDTVLFRYATFLRVQGDKAVIFDLHNADYYCHVFTYPDFRYVSSFAKRGEGPDELLLADNVRWAGEEEVWVLDNAKNRMTRYSGIARGKTPKLEEHVKLEKSLMRAFDFDTYLEGQVLIPDYSGKSRFCWVNLPAGTIERRWLEIPMADKERLAESPQAAAAGWYSFMAFSPDRLHLVAACQFADRLDIYRVSDGSVVTKLGDENREPKFEVTREGYGVASGSICHYDVQVTDRYIYTVYDGRRFRDIIKLGEGYKQGGCRFRVHSLQGELLKEYQLDRPITGIYVDEATGVLYGLDVNADEQIVRFPGFRMPQ